MHGATQNRLIATLDEQSEIVFVSIYSWPVSGSRVGSSNISVDIYVYSIGAEVKCKDIP